MESKKNNVFNGGQDSGYMQTVLLIHFISFYLNYEHYEIKCVASNTCMEEFSSSEAWRPCLSKPPDTTHLYFCKVLQKKSA